MSASAEIGRLKQALADAKLVCDQMEEESLALKDELQVAKIANKVITAETIAGFRKTQSSESS